MRFRKCVIAFQFPGSPLIYPIIARKREPRTVYTGRTGNEAISGWLVSISQASRESRIQNNNKGDPAGIVTSNNKTIKSNDSESTKLEQSVKSNDSCNE